MTIFRDFRSRLELPIKLADVYDYVRASGLADEIEIFEAEANSEILRGQFHLTETLPPPYGRPRRLVRIAVATGLAEAERRLVIVKELLHVYDDTQVRVSTREGVDRLIAELVAPPTLKASIPTTNDRATEIKALPILLPWAAIQALKPAVQDGRMSFEDVAHLARVPVPHTRFVFEDWWPDMVQDIERTLEPEVPRDAAE